MTTESRPMGLLNTLASLVIIVLVALMVIAIWPYAKSQLATVPTILIATSAPAATARPVATVRPITQPGTTTNTAPTVAPITNPNVANSPSDADALVATAIAAQAAASGGVEGVKESPRGSVDVNEKPAPDQSDATIILPTVAAPTDGSPPNPSKGQCLHGQVFTTRGCKNPVTP